jgi:ribosomal protein L44E
MVNIPKERKTYCKNAKCRKHTVHKVTQYKAGKASGFAQGTSGGCRGQIAVLNRDATGVRHGVTFASPLPSRSVRCRKEAI